MKYSMLLGAAAVVLATNAMAATYPAAKAILQVDGMTTASTFSACGVAGTPSHSTILYPGLNKTGLSLIIPSSTSAGPATTVNCIQGHITSGKLVKELTPATGGLDGHTLNFVCFSDTSTTLQAVGAATPATVQFTVKPGRSAVNGWTAKTVTTIPSICTTTGETTWGAE